MAQKHCLDYHSGIADGFPRRTHFLRHFAHPNSFARPAYLVRVHINTLRMATCPGYQESCQFHIQAEAECKSIGSQTQLQL